MINKKFILNADYFGKDKETNQAVLEGYVNGFLTSASLCANAEAFNNAVNDILPDCQNLSIGVHLNITSGKSITNCPLLTDNDSIFDIGYLYLLRNRKNKTLLNQIEKEFRAQIEKIIQYTEVEHLDSYMHIHAIPEIFEIVCKLAQEYNIRYVRTQYEHLYFVPKIVKLLNLKFLTNIIILFTLQHFTKNNRKIVDKYRLKTNDFILGIGYENMMDAESIEYGLQEIEEESLTEVIIHPRKYETSQKDSHTKEFSITQNLTLKDNIIRQGFDIINFKI